MSLLKTIQGPTGQDIATLIDAIADNTGNTELIQLSAQHVEAINKHLQTISQRKTTPKEGMKAGARLFSTIAKKTKTKIDDVVANMLNKFV